MTISCNISAWFEKVSYVSLQRLIQMFLKRNVDFSWMDNKPSTSLPVNIKLMVNMRKFWSDTIDPQLIFCIEIPIKKTFEYWLRGKVREVAVRRLWHVKFWSDTFDPQLIFCIEISIVGERWRGVAVRILQNRGSTAVKK